MGYAVWLIVSAAFCGMCLQYLATRLHKQDRLSLLTERINNELPQLQCGECHYPGCRPYAEAIAKEEAGINLCPPGGTETVIRLANLLGTNAPSLETVADERQVAFIRTDECVGCTLCLPVCPTDAIVGAARQAHVVITEDCVGCNLCLPPCPVDCIDMVPRTQAVSIVLDPRQGAHQPPFCA